MHGDQRVTRLTSECPPCNRRGRNPATTARYGRRLGDSWLRPAVGEACPMAHIWCGEGGQPSALQRPGSSADTYEICALARCERTRETRLWRCPLKEKTLCYLWMFFPQHATQCVLQPLSRRETCLQNTATDIYMICHTGMSTNNDSNTRIVTCDAAKRSLFRKVRRCAVAGAWT